MKWLELEVLAETGNISFTNMSVYLTFKAESEFLFGDFVEYENSFLAFLVCLCEVASLNNIYTHKLQEVV